MNDSNAPATKGDLRILSAALQALGAETKGDLQTHRAETKSDLQTLRAETKSDLQTLRAEMKGDIQGFLVELRGELSAQFSAQDQRWEGKMDVRDQRLRDDMRELVHKTETNLLQAFYSYAEGNNKRLNQVEGNSGIVLNRLGTIEERLLRVEKRLNIPPSL